MKTHIYTRLLVLLLSLVLGLSVLAMGGGVTAHAAAGDTDKTYSIAVSGNGWGHPALKYMNGSSHDASDHWNFLFVNAAGHYICYCIEPGVHIGNWATDDTTYTEKDEAWFNNNAGNFNNTIGRDAVKELLGRIMQYGYIGTVDWDWQNKAEDTSHRRPVADAIATQILVWEVIVGERDEDFNHVTIPYGCNRVLELISTSHPLRQEIITAYEDIEYSIKTHVGKPSFLAKTLSEAQTVTLTWDGSKYSATLTDTNNVLSSYKFTTNNSSVTCSINGNKLTLSASTAPMDTVMLTATKQTTRRGVLVWYKGSSQTMISYSQEVDDPIRGYIKVQTEQKGTAKIVKDTTNGGDKSGWHFLVKDSSGNKVGSYVTNSTGIIILGLEPGTYTVTETDGPYNYWVNDPEPTKTVTVTAGQTATVKFLNKWNGRAKIVKTLTNPEAGSLAGWPFTVQNSSGTTLGTYTTNASGEIVLDLEPGTYTVTEVLPEDSLWECPDGITRTVTVKAGQTAVVTYTNALRPGEILVQKENTKGVPLDGVEFLLEWSEDGIVWSPVTYTDSTIPQIGGCTTEGLTEGKLTSGTDGLVIFTGLYPTLQYRLTEVAAPDGYQLLTEPAYEGTLPVDSLKISLKVVNAEIFTLPQTGAKSMTLLPLGVALCLAICAGAIVSLRRKEV